MKIKKILSFDNILLFLLIIILPISYWDLFLLQKNFLIGIAILATLPVISSAYVAIANKKISVDLLASVALIFSLLSHEWISAIFINLMLTSARIFTTYNENRARKNIEGLLKLKPKKVKIKREELKLRNPINLRNLNHSYHFDKFKF